VIRLWLRLRLQRNVAALAPSPGYKEMLYSSGFRLHNTVVKILPVAAAMEVKTTAKKVLSILFKTIADGCIERKTN
jgi:hypothetical protein